MNVRTVHRPCIGAHSSYSPEINFFNSTLSVFCSALLSTESRRTVSFPVKHTVAGETANRSEVYRQLCRTRGSLRSAILTESALSFLGLGVQPPAASWGNMLSGAQTYLTSSPLLAVYPGMLTLVTVLAVNAVGDGLRESVQGASQSRV